MNKSILFLSIISLLALNSNAQTATINSANKLFFKKLYMEAIPKYESVLKKDSSNADVLMNLGDCYRLTNNNKGQLNSYGKLVRSGKAEDIHKLYYGQALMEAGRYDEAKKYVEDFKADNRGEKFAKAITNLQKFSKDADAYKIDTVSFNSNFNDFSAITFLENKVVFASSKTKTTWITRRHGWTGNNYCHMYMTEKDASGKYEKPAIFLEDFKFRGILYKETDHDLNSK